MKTLCLEKFSFILSKLAILISKIVQFFRKRFGDKNARQQFSVSSDYDDYLQLKTKLILELSR